MSKRGRREEVRKGAYEEGCEGGRKDGGNSLEMVFTTLQYTSHTNLTPPFSLTCLCPLIWAAEPTRLTERPTLMAGRMPL